MTITTASMIVITSKRQKKAHATLTEAGYLLIDVTSSSAHETFQRFSPFYPHKNIPIPGMAQGSFSSSVEGIWQGLKVFEKEGIDVKKFGITNMKNIKRAVGAKRGKVLGHMFDGRTLQYVEARKMIYVPAYNYVLKHFLSNEVDLLKGLIREGKKIALVDFDINEDIENTSKPLSHASLIKNHILCECTSS